MTANLESVSTALSGVLDPDLGKDVNTLGWIRDLAVDGSRASFELHLASPADPHADALEAACRQAVSAVDGIQDVEVRRGFTVVPSRIDPGGLAAGVKNFIAVGSGKGGVGKSTVSANLAVALAQTGARTALLDADVYGPSVPTLMGIHGKPKIEETPDGRQMMHPTEAHGVQCMSIGFLIDPDQPVIWRGPMVHKMIQSFIAQVEWGEVDYLVVDMPPGTGDIQLTLGQTIPLTGAVIVSTPQDVALADALKCYQCFREMKVTLFGVVENMSSFICPDCSSSHDIFGKGGAEKMAERLELPFLGDIPLETLTRVASDEGSPVTVSHPESRTASAFRALAGKLARQILIRNLEAPIPIKLTVS